MLKNSKINVLIIGSGGREHALVSKILKSKLCQEVYAIPGNDLWINVKSFAKINVNNNDEILNFAQKYNINLVIIGPEDILKNDLVTKLNQNNISTFAPNKKAAMIEIDKNYSKQLMQKYNIPTAKYESFSDFKNAKNYINNNNYYPIVIKSSNLAQGKGVLIAKTENEAINYLDLLLNKNCYGKNNIAVIEDYLIGEEFSLMCLVNEEKIYPLPAVKDHKRINNNDQGLNTGGMGVISDLNFLTDNDIKLAIDSCIIPLTKALILEKINYLGVIFAGIMKLNDGSFKVIEYNARFGDPETQIVLEKIDCDFLEFIIAVINKKDFKYKIKTKKAAGIVIASKGYPQDYQKNLNLNFLKNEKNIYYMGAIKEGESIISKTGRIFMIYATDKEDPSAIIYQKLKKLNLDLTKFHWREDIKWKK